MPDTNSRITIIVAAASDGAIGRGGDMPFRLSSDLKRFKSITLGHPIVMGRKTFESLPGGALPGRRNIVVTRRDDFHSEGVETARSLDEALTMAAEGSPREIMVIGGGEIYRQALPIASRLYLTEVAATFPGADTYFPEIAADEWAVEEVSECFTDPRSGLGYRFVNLLRL